jgi:NDP-mannose synthase
MQAVIMAGGKGTRLRPYTSIFPKPLVPLGDMPVLELILRQLAYYGFKDVVLAVGHLSELIQAYFGDGSKLGVRLRYVQESKPLGTIGPLKLIDALDESFLVMNGDVVTDLNYGDLFSQHQHSGAEATLALYQKTTQIEFGVLDFEPKTLQITQFREKPVFVHPISMGIHVFRRSVLQHIITEQLYGLDHLMAALLTPEASQQKTSKNGSSPSVAQTKTNIKAYPFEGYWLDIGRHGDYQDALSEFELMRHRLLPDHFKEALATRETIPLMPISGQAAQVAIPLEAYLPNASKAGNAKVPKQNSLIPIQTLKGG